MSRTQLTSRDACCSQYTLVQYFLSAQSDAALPVLCLDVRLASLSPLLRRAFVPFSVGKERISRFESLTFASLHNSSDTDSDHCHPIVGNIFIARHLYTEKVPELQIPTKSSDESDAERQRYHSFVAIQRKRCSDAQNGSADYGSYGRQPTNRHSSH